MKTTVQKWGNSLVIRISRNISKDTGVTEGTTINMAVEKGNIILSPSKKEYSLQELLKNITNENIHSEISTGRRPAITLSPKAYNQKVGLAIFCPITSQEKGYPFEVKINERKLQGDSLSLDL